MLSKKRIIILSAIFLLAFVLFSYFVHQGFFKQIDFDSTVRLQDKLTRAFDTPFSLLSLVGSLEIVGMILLVLLVLFRKLRAFIVLAFFILMHIPELFGKAFVDHPGPPFMFFRYDIPFLFPSSYVQPGSSYPSGHAARTIFISIIAAFLISKLKLSKNQKYVLYILIFAFDLLMFVSRIYLAEHWTSDVIGGIFLGAAFGVLSLLLL